MKKPIRLLYASVLIAGITLAKPIPVNAQAFTNNSTSLTAGYGLVTFLGSNEIVDYYYYETVKSHTGPFYLKAERGVSEHIGIGLNFAYAKNEWKTEYDDYDNNGNPIVFTETDTRTTFSILARINFHLGYSKKFDPYLGIGLGYRQAHWSTDTDNPIAAFDSFIESPVGMDIGIGVRYFIIPNIGAYAEVGLAKSLFQGGLVFNLPGKSSEKFEDDFE